MYKNVNKGKTKSLVFPLKYYIIHFLSRVKTSGQARPLQECDKLGLFYFFKFSSLLKNDFSSISYSSCEHNSLHFL